MCHDVKAAADHTVPFITLLQLMYDAALYVPLPPCILYRANLLGYTRLLLEIQCTRASRNIAQRASSLLSPPDT